MSGSILTRDEIGNVDLVGLGQAGLGLVEFPYDPCSEHLQLEKKCNGTKCRNSMLLAKSSFFEQRSFKMIEK